MKTVPDKILTTVFIGFITAVSMASVTESNPALDAVTGAVVSYSVPEADAKPINTVVPYPAQAPLMVLTFDQLREIRSWGAAYSTEHVNSAIPVWQQMFYVAKVPYDLFMKIPVAVQVLLALYIARKYMPNLAADALWETVKIGSGAAYDAAADIGSGATSLAQKKLMSPMPITVSQALSNVTQGMAVRHAAWAESNLDGFAKWLGF